MYIPANKAQRDKNYSVGHESFQNHAKIQSIFQFVDNRPGTIAQRKLHEIANNSNRVVQLKAFQLKATTRPQTQHSAQLKAITENYAASTAPAIQFYTEEKKDYKVSDGGNYMVSNKEAERSILWVKENGPKPTGFFEEIGSDEANKMKRFIPKAKFGPKPKDGYKEFEGPNDCGRYAGALSTNTTNWGNTNLLKDLVQPDTGKSPYGKGFGEGKEAAKDPKAVEPGIGEAYYMWKPPERDDYTEMFHVAPAVAKDESDTITSEADSSAKYLLPIFNMYGTKKKGQSFHDRYLKRFSTYEEKEFDETKVEGRPKNPQEKDLNVHVKRMLLDPEYKEKLAKYHLDRRDWNEVKIPSLRLAHAENPDNRKYLDDAKITILKNEKSKEK